MMRKPRDSSGEAVGQFDSSLLADTKRTEFRDDKGEVFYTAYEKLAPNETAKRSAEPFVLALTGIGCQGIGQAIALEFAVKRQATVVACDKDGKRGARAAREVELAGGCIHFVEADVSKEVGVQRFVDEIASKTGRADAVVCNAGSAFDPKSDNILDLTFEQYRALIDANLTSAFLTTKLMLKKFFIPQQSGMVVFLGSQNSEHPVLSQLGYSMAKAAIQPLKNHLVLQFGRFLPANTVRPGPVRTQSTNWENRLDIDPDWEYHEAHVLNGTGRLTRPDEVASVIGWLVAEAPSHVNGLDIPVDGGFEAVGFRVGTAGRNSIVRVGRLLTQKDRDERKDAA